MTQKIYKKIVLREYNMMSLYYHCHKVVPIDNRDIEVNIGLLADFTQGSSTALWVHTTSITDHLNP